MSLDGELEYAYARLCARVGERPDELAWRSIEAIRALPAFLEAARNLPFKRWLVDITADADAHRIEAALAARRRALVVEVARWMPGPWQAAIHWAGVLPELPAIEHLARGGEALPWMRQDALLAPLCEVGTPGAGPLASLANEWRRPDGLLHAWRTEWTRRLPNGALTRSASIHELARLFATTRTATYVSSAHRPIADSQRAMLAERLALLFRRSTLDPAAAFVFLALIALDLERLRGELLRRAIFPTFRKAA
jgi:hypothetical protein